MQSMHEALISLLTELILMHHKIWQTLHSVLDMSADVFSRPRHLFCYEMCERNNSSKAVFISWWKDRVISQKSMMSLYSREFCMEISIRTNPTTKRQNSKFMRRVHSNYKMQKVHCDEKQKRRNVRYLHEILSLLLFQGKKEAWKARLHERGVTSPLMM
jgi:hypothetical protein